MASIKQLESEQKGLKGQLSAVEKDLKSLQNRKKEIEKDIELIDRKLKARQSSGLVITEHAILRYLERIKKIDIEEIKQLIAPPKTEKMIKAFGGKGIFPVGTHQIVVEYNTIKTIL